MTMNRKKLTEQDRKEIKALLNAGNSIRSVSDALGWSRTTVYMVKTGRDWSDYYTRESHAKHTKAYRERRRMKGKAA